LNFHGADQESEHAPRLCARGRRILRLAGGAGRDADYGDQSVHVAAYIEQLQKPRSAPTAKLRLAALRHLFDWMVLAAFAREGWQATCHALPSQSRSLPA
jgi:hypothetical protein